MRNTDYLKYDWKFIKADVDGAWDTDFDDDAWETVRVPHDWAIGGPFDEETDIHTQPILEDGEDRMMRHTGRTAGLPHVGVGWYRRELDIPPSAGAGRVFLEFDGVMSHSEVFVNGKKAGGRPFGYSSFQVEITDLVSPGGRNVVAVRADNPPLASRWYPGAGLYRNVRLVTTGACRIGYQGIHVEPELDGGEGRVRVNVDLEGNLEGVTVQSVLLDPSGKPLDPAELAEITDAEGDREGRVVLEHSVAKPVLWDTDSPRLYDCLVTLLKGEDVIDQVETRFGFRTIGFDGKEGFFLNGKPTVFKGVCQHHDLGALGAAVNRRGLERQLEILASMGCNAIRTSHNPPEPMLLDLCDEMGFLVMDEAFDEWRVAKVENGYHNEFDEWAERDLTDLIRRDRNHPCVVLWSIGNEIRDQEIPAGRDTARFLAEIVRREDPSRPVTAGFNNPVGAMKHGLAMEVDIPGWNYKPNLYEEYRKSFPETAMIGSETSSCTSTRGYYHFPVDEVRSRALVREVNYASSYDIEGPDWAYAPEVEFGALENLSYMCGEFVWTGFDYLGEPTPFGEAWPARSSYFGIIDLCGFPKDRYYNYKSMWSDEPVLHLLPHWTWPNRIGLTTPVHCYTNYNRVELFLNGRSLGVKTREPLTVPENKLLAPRLGQHRLAWEDVVYEPGKLEAVAYDAHGREAARTVVETAGAPAILRLRADRNELEADGDDLAYVTVDVADEKGRLCPAAENLVRFSIEGPGEILAVDNGDQTSLDSFQARERRAFFGKCLVVVRTLQGQGGTIIIRAESEGLASSVVEISSQ